MKGYFQRMAASALSRERTVHPVLGSLWAPQNRADSFAAFGETAEQETKPQRTQDAEQVQAPIETQMLVQPVRVDSPQVDREPRSGRMPHAESNAEMPMRDVREGQRATAMSALPLAASHGASLRGESDGESHAASDPQRRSFKPLVAESSQWSQPSQNVTPSVAAPRPDASRRQPPAQPAREPDSIEIHIGRIEVLAAQPQPVQRPPAQPVRKSLDLGDYLRRSGRAR